MAASGQESAEQLIRGFAELSSSASAQPDTASAAGVIARFAVALVPGCQVASVSRYRLGRLQTLGVSEAFARQVDHAQHVAGTGPSFDAMLDNTQVISSDLRTDHRWPRFGRVAARSLGLNSVAAFPLVTGSDVIDDGELIAGLTLYSRRRDAFDDLSCGIARNLATHASVALVAVATRELARNLGQALASNRVIATAVGIVMSGHRITRDQAFDLLVVASQKANAKIVDIANDVVETGILDPRRRRQVRFATE